MDPNQDVDSAMLPQRLLGLFQLLVVAGMHWPVATSLQSSRLAFSSFSLLPLHITFSSYVSNILMPPSYGCIVAFRFHLDNPGSSISPSQDSEFIHICKSPFSIYCRIYKHWRLGPDIFGGHFSVYHRVGNWKPMILAHRNCYNGKIWILGWAK